MKNQDFVVGQLNRTSFGDTVSHTVNGTALPFIPAWDTNYGSRTVTTATAYDINFQDVATKKGKERARAEMQQRSNLRLKDPARIRGSTDVGVGDLISYTNASAGERKVQVRVQEVTHVINKGGWTTEVSFKEDEPEITTNITG